MTLFLLAIDAKNEFRDFSLVLDSFETVCDFLSRIIARGTHIIKAEVVDNSQRMPLPSEVFDGQLFSPAMQQLESEWRQILEVPVAITPAPDQWLVHLIQQRTKRQNDFVSHLELAIKAAELELQQAQNYVGSESYRLRLIDQYTYRINQFNRYLSQAVAKRDYNSLQWFQERLAAKRLSTACEPKY